MTLHITPGELQAIAAAASGIGKKLSTAATSGEVSAATSAAASSMSGWSSVQKLSSVETQWDSKTKALVTGPAGLEDFSASLRDLSTDVQSKDADNATAIKSTMGGMSGEYSPSHDTTDSQRLQNTELNGKLGMNAY
ncbi:MAG: hypothetical protein ACRD0P_31930 [Stackebrandtia sp.]